MAQAKYAYPEFSGGIQQKSNNYIKQPKEVNDATNADFYAVIGSAQQRKGMQSTEANLPKMPDDLPASGAFVARFPDANEIWASSNSADASETIVRRHIGPAPTDWEDVITGLPPNAEVNMAYDLSEVWVASYDPATDTIGDSYTVDESHDASQTRQLKFGPKARFFMEFAGSMWGINAEVDGVRYPDRAYKSSGPTGAITFVRSPQTDVSSVDIAEDLLNQVPTMTSATAPAGVVSWSTAANSNTVGWKAFDKDTATGNGRWVSASTNLPSQPEWIQYDFGAGNEKVITYYTIRPLADSDGANNHKRRPRDFRLQASNDGVSYTVLHSASDVEWGDTHSQRTFSVNNTESYRYYQLVITHREAGGSGDTYVEVAELYLQSLASGSKSLKLLVDSARFLKPGMELDIYKGGTDELKYKITVETVDKVEDSITFIPHQVNFSSGEVNTGANTITLPSTEQFTTGQPIIFSTTNSLPDPLQPNITYYAIRVDATTIKVAQTKAAAQIDDPTILTTAGSGTQNVRLSYIFGNKDELWGRDRKGKLTRYWNTDYRTPESADWIKLPSTLDNNSFITATATSGGRWFLFTTNTMFKIAGTQTGNNPNITALRNDVGCISHRTIAHYDNFMVWLDARGQVWYRNEEAGEQDVISEPVDDIIALIPRDELVNASAIASRGKYKLTLGTYEGKTLRLVYNFKSSQWTKELFDPKTPVYLEYVYDHQIHPHFFDEVGQMWVDEEGDTDNGQVMHFELETGHDDFQQDELKKFYGMKVWGENVAGAKVLISLDRKQYRTAGQLTESVQKIPFRQGEVDKIGTTISIKITNSSARTPIRIDKIIVYYNKEEDTF